MSMAKSGGNILVASLRAEGVKRIYCVPGESYLDALDALHDANDIALYTCRQEGGAAFMAEADAKLTGEVGVCFVTRGPGACNASIGVHTAMQDSTPMVLLVGQVGREMMGREAFQEIDYRQMFAPPITKWAVQAGSAAELPEIVRKAFHTARSGRPGPVVIALPEDVLSEDAVATALEPLPVERASPAIADIGRLREILSTAQRPVVLTGGGCWDDASIKIFEDFCQRSDLPVVAGFRRQDAFHNRHDCYVGVLGTTVDATLVKAVAEADVVLALGTRLGEILTQGYSVITPGKPKQKLIHVYPDASELNKVYQAELAIHADVRTFAAALQDVTVAGGAWRGWKEKLRAQFVAWSTVRTRDKFTPDLDGIIDDLNRLLPEDAVITTDAGNFSGWAQRYLAYDRPRRLLAPTSGAMGYGVPSAVAASLACPRRCVVGLMGDGGFLMTGQEIATAVHEGATPIWIVFNNGMYGTIRMHQEKHYPKRISATNLTNPDFAALARSYGVDGYVVEKNDDFSRHFQAARASGKPALIEIRMDAEQITTQKKLSEL